MKKLGYYIQILANLLLGIAIMFFAIGVFGKPTEAEANIGKFDTIKYNEGWMLKCGDEITEISLPNEVLCERGEKVLLENTLPDYVTDGMDVFVRSSMQETRIYIDGKLRESYTGDELEHVGSYIPSAYIVADLKEQDAGKVIGIELTISTHTKLNEVILGYGNNAWFSICRRNIPVTVATILAVIVGVVAIGSYFVLRKTIRDGKTIFYLGQSIIIIGLWIFSESEIRQLMFQRPSYSAFFAYILIELVCGFVALYFNEIQRNRYHKAYIIVEILVFGQAAVNMILHVAGIAEFYETLVFSHIWLILGMLVAFSTVIIDLITKRVKEYAMSAWGMLIFLLFSIMEIVGFYTRKHYVIGVYMCIGLILLLVVTVIQVLSDEMNKVRTNLEMEKFQTELEQKVEEQTVELRNQQEKRRKLYIQTITALSDAVDAKDRYTSGHSKRVAKYAQMIAAKMGKSIEEQQKIYQAGLLHDIGKIRVPADIINKPGKLTDEEFNIIKLHPITGYRILESVSDDGFIAIAAKYHHERYDGKGYPNGLKGETIPEVARILGVADSYDAMASNRSYRNALPQSAVRAEIERCKGTQFDPYIADVMIQMIDEDTEYAMKQIESMHRRILVVDDDTMNNKLIAHIMRDEPMYEIVAVTSGQEALDILDEQNFDMILLDVWMPDMNGLETLKRIRVKHQMPVVLISGDKTLDISADLAELGCDEYITKPFLPLLIKEVIHTMTEHMEIMIEK